MSQVIFQDALGLSIEDRLKLIEQLWESITATPNAVPITSAQKAELDRRLADHQMNPDDLCSVEEVLDGLD